MTSRNSIVNYSHFFYHTKNMRLCCSFRQVAFQLFVYFFNETTTKDYRSSDFNRFKATGLWFADI